MLHLALRLLDKGIVACPVLPGSKFIDFTAMGGMPGAQINDEKWRRKLAHTSTAFIMSIRPTSPSDVEAWFSAAGDSANLGIVCGLGSLVVLDFDDDNAFDRFRRANPTLADRTPVEKTPNGYHVYLKVSGVVFSTSLYIGIRKGGHVSGVGGFVTCAPSTLEDGRAYRWLPGQSIFDVDPQPVDDLRQLGVSTSRARAVLQTLIKPFRARTHGGAETKIGRL
ncbi:bifunctional DNA primase/polymerase [Mesorhizobium sp. ES1-1]|uniref:bifunctional DNA primase/polymerase n=1 Tax=Mesorhizobium sp. ES1-1 TaxID=2876629 RepID=UPI001CCA7157|nr:bifunctional DNA primase/polymerase [Mesorhizobium sp. ES1-1]MBZ9678121.1 bifunctional DNA primase/polymerase [Mesorhizobium sp. ES1-1]